MPQVTYTSRAAVTQANKARAYDLLCSLIAHLPAFGVDLLSLSVGADRYVTVTLTGPIPDDQREHLGLA